jgi:hypothetical protein
MNGYVPYNESLYRVGFRPYGTTDPRRAATLGGMEGPIQHSYGGFGPWTLHGLGQTDPFGRAKGGWALHGLAALGDMVADGSIVTYTGTWMPHGTQGAADVIAQVGTILGQEGLAVRSVSSSAYRFLLNNTFNVKLVVQVTNGLGYQDPSDVAKIIDNAAWQVTGSMPLASSISSVQAPGGSAPVPTGQPEIPDTGSGSGQQPSSTQDWSSWLQNNFGLLAALAVGLVVVPPLIKRIL